MCVVGAAPANHFNPWLLAPLHPAENVNHPGNAIHV
jgi:hypothetical protein